MSRPIPDPERPYLDSSSAGWTCSKCGTDSADGWGHTRYCPVAVQDRTTWNANELLVSHSPWPCKVQCHSQDYHTITLVRIGKPKPLAMDARFETREVTQEAERLDCQRIQYGPMEERRTRRSRWPIFALQWRAWDPVSRTIFQSFVEWYADIPPGMATWPRKKHL